MDKNLKTRLNHAVTRWDRAQSTRKDYNPNALALYLGRVPDVVSAVRKGATLRDAIGREYNDRLRDYLIKNIANETP